VEYFIFYDSGHNFWVNFCITLDYQKINIMKKMILSGTIVLLFSCKDNKSAEVYKSDSISVDNTASDSVIVSSQNNNSATDSVANNSSTRDTASLKRDSVQRR
jgi:hypothetical protein